MMRAVAETTRPHGIKTVVSLNSVMVDGTGMCGGCRVSVDGKSQFACVDGPEFDAHRVDFQNLANRNAMYREMEARALREFLAHRERAGPACRGTSAACSRRADGPDRRGRGMKNPLSPKERVKIPRQRMPEQEPAAAPAELRRR